MNQNNKGLLLALATAFISGLAIFINQFGVKIISPEIYTFLKNLVAGVLVFGIILIFKEWPEVKKLRIKDLGLLSLIGLVGGSIPFLLFFKGLAMTTAGNGALIHKTMFLFVAVLAIVFLKEKVSRKMILGVSLLLIGNVLLLKFNSSNILNKGDLLILLATVLWAIENIISKKAVSKISPRIVAGGRMFFGCLFIMIYLAFTNQLSPLSSLSLSQLSWVLITGLILAAYLITWYSGIKYIRISTASCILALGAPITATLALIQGKGITIFQLYGILILVIGLSLVIFSSSAIGYYGRKEPNH